MTRVAQCHCGQVRLTVEGEPSPVILCHCTLCQRRTGSLIHIGAWFEKEDITFEGETRTYTRTNGDLGMEATTHFCPVCGTSVWWPAPIGAPLEGKIGIAGGCFADPGFPAPDISMYEKHRHPWITVPETAKCYREAW